MRSNNLSIILAFVMIATNAFVSASKAQTNETHSGCYPRSAENLALYNKISSELVSQGQLSAEEQVRYRCHPEQTRNNTSVKVVRNSSLSDRAQENTSLRASVSCGDGYIYKKTADQHWSWGTPTAVEWTVNTWWCYNKKTKKVKDWGGICNPTVTAWGTVNLWYNNGGCDRNDFVPYVLNNSYPGGVDHITHVTFSNHLWFIPDQSIGPFYMWGHYDGTCDERDGNDGPVRHYC